MEEDNYYSSVAAAVLESIRDKIDKSHLIGQTLTQVNADETDLSAASEVVDAIQLSELASVMGGDYAVARMALSLYNKQINTYISACHYIPQTEDQIKLRFEEMFLETVGQILKQLDN